MPMSTYERLSSDDSSDCFGHDFKAITGHSRSTLKTEWDAIESYLYQEDDPNILNLKPSILQECRTWRESFTYLRIRGRQLQEPDADRRLHWKQQMVDAVIDRVIDKIANGFNITYDNMGSDKTCESRVQRPNAASRESYFERGKTRNENEKSALPKDSSKRIINSDTQDSKQTSTYPLPLPKPPPRGILKNSPARLAQHKRHRNRNKQDSNCQNSSANTAKVTTLPRIASKNNWLEQSKKRGENSTNYFRVKNTFRDKTSSSRIVTSDYFILPSINQNIGM